MEELSKPANLEILKVPEIIVQDEEGAQFLSLILKARDPDWGGAENELEKETREYFKVNPLDKETSEFLYQIRALWDNGVDEEVLYVLALTYGHPKREAGAFDMIQKHKEYLLQIIEPRELQQKLFGAIDAMRQSFSASPLSERFRSKTEEDKKARLENIQETIKRIEKIIEFYKPNPDTSKVRRISLMPSDPLYGVNSGHGPSFGEETVIRNNIDNPDNIDHEFSHSIINPIVEKLDKQLTDEQKEKISKMASDKRKYEEKYGEYYFSLLCEEFIRIYNEVFKKREKPRTYENFLKIINGKTEEQFSEELANNKNSKAAFDELGIKNMSDLKAKSKEFYDRFLKDSQREVNELGDLIYEFYKEYVNRSDQNINFEQFVLENFPKKI